MNLSPAAVQELVAARVREIPDFPQPGVVFKDITPLLADPAAFRTTVNYLGRSLQDFGAEVVVGIEARGFVLAAPAAVVAGISLVPQRKPGKLPGETLRQAYALEYGEAALEMHRDAIKPGSQVVIMDDVLATGGTAQAAAALVERAGGQVLGYSFLIELDALGGRTKLPGRRIDSLLRC